MKLLGKRSAVIAASALVLTSPGVHASAQGTVTRSVAAAAVGAEARAALIVPPPDYVIGPEDQLSITFFQNRDMSADVVVVRPDGKISVPLINDITASGLTPEELRARVTVEAKRFVQEPNVTIVVRQINSRKVSILGSVERPGTYPLAGPTSVLQLIAAAAGLKEYAQKEKIAVMRTQDGRQLTLKFNYKEVLAQKHLEQNIQLRPGDIVVVP